MCGILGTINFEFKPESLKSISHRGPDGDGVQTFQTNGHTVTLAHRRLSIVDVSANGAQPMFSGNKQSCITFNGEIYNHDVLKNEIDHSHFKGHSDTETLVNYFNENNVLQNLDKLNGIFGFAIYDQENKKLYLTRDRFGVKPVYYYFEDNQVIFSSEIRPFQYYLDMKYDKENIVEGLKMRYVGAPDTIYRKIKKVEPGQLITFDLSGPVLTANYSYYITSTKKGNKKQDLSLLVKEYGQLFEQAVQRQLMADVEIGVLLSGGIDSALVAAVAKNQSTVPIKTFTVGFAEGLFKSDEIDMARVTAETLGLENIHTRVTFTDFIEDLKKIVKIVEEPIATNSIIPMYSLSKLVADNGVKVVLTGQGADEPLYGYRKYKGLIFLQPLRNSSLLRTGLRLSGAGRVKKEDVRRFYEAAVEKDMFSSYREFNSITSRTEMKELLNKEGETEISTMLLRKNDYFREKWQSRVPSSKAIVSFPFLDLRNSLADDLLMYTDKLMMNFGVEGRVPILDNDLVDFIESIHHTYKFNFSKGKIIHKEFANTYLPESIINRKKIGFATPASAWYQTYSKEIEEIICSSEEVQELFNIKMVRQLLNDHSKNQTREKQILMLLSIALLTK